MRPSVRPHGVSLQTFPRLPVRFTHHGYGCLWDFAVLCQLIHMVRLISAVTAMDTATSCPSGHDFAIPSSRLFLTVQTLGVAIGFVGNYAPWDFHPRFGTCPSHKGSLACGKPLNLCTNRAFMPDLSSYPLNCLFIMSHISVKAAKKRTTEAMQTAATTLQANLWCHRR